jgi:MOSC domain-containing protein YiiM
MSTVESVNIGRPRPNPDKDVDATGIDKHPVDGPVEVRDPGPKTTGLGSGLVGDFVGDVANHGGTDQAVYAFAREDLDDWEARLGRSLPNGYFGENLTTGGIDVAAALIGERWQIGETVVLQVREPRIPCTTFRGRMGEKGWLKTFTAVARPGAYLQVLVPGTIRGGDALRVIHRPAHDVTISLAYRAVMTERELLPRLLAAGEDLPAELHQIANRYSSSATSSAARSPERTAPSM